MRISKRDSTDERRVLTGMIVDQIVLANIADKWDGKMFNNRWSNLIGKWCVDFYRRYDKAPGPAIEGLFESWSQGAHDDDTVQLVEKFLTRLSGDYDELAKESNSDYLVDRAAEHFNRVRLDRLKEALSGDIDANDVTSAILKVQQFDRLEMGQGSAVDVLQDQQAIRDAFERRSEVLIQYPGALANFFGTSLERDGLIAFMGPEKRGKTFWLMDLAWRAVLQRRRTAFFAVGDMSQDQMLRRFAIRACRRPLDAKKIKYPKQLVKDPDQDIAEPLLELKQYTKQLTWQKAWHTFQETATRRIKSKDPYLRMSVHPNSSINVAGIKSIVAGWERRGWTPDVIVIDYADILAPPAGSGDETRNQTNATWKQLRALSQSLHCLVVTATQSDAQSYNADTVRRTHFSEDKRKLAHVTGLIGLNATEPETELGLMRLNWIVLRESKFTESQCVHVAGCLDIANPALLSTF